MNVAGEDGATRRNRAEHRVDFTEVERFDFEDALEIDVADTVADGEVRRAALGFIGNRLHMLVYVELGDRIRVISLRRATRRERLRYERHHIG
ncbi:BrnT family toxin [Roseitalea porphyridii]|uniref:BrnT family toxin n=1 Tax=Roseitalea porphyridii TaxID=1852022 RepID=A0A4P6V509_9HYPH|nr:BrnT family toxin [Roseitalea porphyridii]